MLCICVRELQIQPFMTGCEYFAKRGRNRPGGLLVMFV